MFKKLKNLFCKKQRIESAEYEDFYQKKYEKIYKTRNAATILVHIMLDPDNANRNFRSLDCYKSKQYSSNTESNNSDKNKN